LDTGHQGLKAGIASKVRLPVGMPTTNLRDETDAVMADFFSKNRKSPRQADCDEPSMGRGFFFFIPIIRIPISV
jgi:hypothetical protein